jgi:hypothetical protein
MRLLPPHPRHPFAAAGLHYRRTASTGAGHALVPPLHHRGRGRKPQETLASAVSWSGETSCDHADWSRAWDSTPLLQPSKAG